MTQLRFLTSDEFSSLSYTFCRVSLLFLNQKLCL